MRNKIISALCLIGLVSVLFAVPTTRDKTDNIKLNEKNYSIQPTVLTTLQKEWVPFDTTTMAGVEPNDLTTDQRTYAKVIADSNGYAAEISVITVPETWNGIKLRCLGTVDGNSVTYQIYIGTIENSTDCDLAYAGQLAWTIGGQVSSTSSSYYCADTLTITSTQATNTAAWSLTSPENDRVAQAKLDLEGENIIVVVPTTANCDAILYGKGF